MSPAPMRRLLPSPAAVRAAAADARRALSAAALPLPESCASIVWTGASRGSVCRFCGDDSPAVRPHSAATGDPASLVICARTLAELTAMPPAPSGPEASNVLDAIDRWMATWISRERSEPSQFEDRAARVVSTKCDVCGRAATDVPALHVGEDIAVCSDCLSRAGAGHVDPAAVDEFAGVEIEQARAEIADLERIRVQSGNPADLRRNPTAALSLIRLLSVPDERTQSLLAALVRSLDAE
jgi:hypothetical protein